MEQAKVGYGNIELPAQTIPAENPALMPNPFRSFQYLPWVALMQSAGLTVLVATALDMLTGTVLVSLPTVGRPLLGIPLFSMVLPIAAAFGVGALAFFLTRQFFNQIPLRTDTLWSLIACVLLVLFVKSWLPVPSLFLRGFDVITMVMVTTGCFTAGRRYWR